MILKLVWRNTTNHLNCHYKASTYSLMQVTAERVLSKELIPDTKSLYYCT